MDMEGILAITLIFGGGTLFLLSISPVGRALADRLRAGHGQPAADPELLAEVDALRQEVAELHERVDFAERILLKSKDRDELGKGASLESGMMILQEPIPPLPPIGPQFDPNLIFMNDGGPPTILLIVIAALAATVIILWPIMRAFGRRLEGKGDSDPVLRADVENLHARLGEVDALQARMAELEERVDFAERLLAQGPAQKGVLRGDGA